MMYVYSTILISMCLVACKASVDTDSKEGSAKSTTARHIVHCSKLIRVSGKYLEEAKEDEKKPPKEDEKSKPKSKSAVTESSTRAEEYLLELNYNLQEDVNGNKTIQCSIDDNHRTYSNSNYVPVNAIGVKNECSIGFDLDKSSGGTFYLEYSTDGGWIDYFDYDNKLQYNFRMRSSECSELSF